MKPTFEESVYLTESYPAQLIVPEDYARLRVSKYDARVEVEKKYDPSQPRHPKGDPRGGQWSSLNPNQGTLFPEDKNVMREYNRQVAQDIADARKYHVHDQRLSEREDEIWEELFYDSDMSREEFNAEYDVAVDNVQDALDDSEVRIAVQGDETLNAILNDGRFKTQFETGSSRGLFDPNARRLAEYRLFGLGGDPDDDDDMTVLANQARPIYGFMSRYHKDAHNDSANIAARQYGDIQIVLSTDVRHRTTFTAGDSLTVDGWGSPRLQPSKITDVRISSVLPRNDLSSGIESKDQLYRLANLDYSTRGKKSKRPDADWLRGIARTRYVEAQIHGGVDVSDIAKVRFPKPYRQPLKPKSELDAHYATVDRLKNLGIKVEYYG